MIAFLCCLPVVACLSLPIWALDKVARDDRGDRASIRRWAGVSLVTGVGLLIVSAALIGPHPVCVLIAATLWGGLLANDIVLVESTFRSAARPTTRGFPMTPTPGEESVSANCPRPDRPI
jgi:hypothetical protein